MIFGWKSTSRYIARTARDTPKLGFPVYRWSDATFWQMQQPVGDGGRTLGGWVLWWVACGLWRVRILAVRPAV